MSGRIGSRTGEGVLPCFEVSALTSGRARAGGLESTEHHCLSDISAQTGVTQHRACIYVCMCVCVYMRVCVCVDSE